MGLGIRRADLASQVSERLLTVTKDREFVEDARTSQRSLEQCDVTGIVLDEKESEASRQNGDPYVGRRLGSRVAKMLRFYAPPDIPQARFVRLRSIMR